MFHWPMICLIPLLCAFGCNNTTTELEGQPSSKTEIYLFFAHTESIDVTAGTPHFSGTVSVDDPRHEKIVRFVEYLASNGIQLQYHDEVRSEWRVVAPTFGPYAVSIESIRAFRGNPTLREMQSECLAINLAHGLNPKADLLMSLPGLTSASDNNKQSEHATTIEEFTKRTTEIRSHPKYVALVKTLKQLFIEYEP